ncbi:tRNA preQ1(34) S-adenosylmethionine ribosyltransferase-isomerase QueA [Desulfobulbus alkaliphilus]|uniref:tRNA preQ1(34) S-adenosylmethionine ribosyltransferase-isomerase QueA n=1 Tax=Desulfobulbus alkaliphilus TaxID=869814 RepID=UPI001965D24B|nr:tRNA preQ1(34) S-adenosylmethionine ribosyltransferase-isomerase QueA [Desulfobulbus alkaliphilus]MBM9537359.1 tRNA preQ1(34) S-adenosylmethionine ribosyltransferase-isomerase QueA [Desulfobulbus alkaliphilus]
MSKEDTHFLEAYDYHLPPAQIAQYPVPQRDQSRLLVLDTTEASPAHHRFSDILSYLRAGDLLVVNSTRVFPARLSGCKQTGGKVELFLLEFPRCVPPANTALNLGEASATALIKSSKRPQPGSLLLFSSSLSARVNSYEEDGKANVSLLFRKKHGHSLEALLEKHGQMPLPPYINRPHGSLGEDSHRYQTRYASRTGSVAAPTAGLHFSDDLLTAIKEKGVEVIEIILHVGYGTFAPVRTTDIRHHVIHSEMVEVSPATAATINRVRAAGGRIWAVGTTTVRTLEFAADPNGQVQALAGPCDLYIYPGYQFRVVDNLITNFHLPRSSLLFLVSALAGRPRILDAYNLAVTAGYRFFSYGDAMAIITRP